MVCAGCGREDFVGKCENCGSLHGVSSQAIGRAKISELKEDWEKKDPMTKSGGEPEKGGSQGGVFWDSICSFVSCTRGSLVQVT